MLWIRPLPTPRNSHVSEGRSERGPRTLCILASLHFFCNTLSLPQLPTPRRDLTGSSIPLGMSSWTPRSLLSLDSSPCRPWRPCLQAALAHTASPLCHSPQRAAPAICIIYSREPHAGRGVSVLFTPVFSGYRTVTKPCLRSMCYKVKHGSLGRTRSDLSRLGPEKQKTFSGASVGKGTVFSATRQLCFLRPERPRGELLNRVVK